MDDIKSLNCKVQNKEEKAKKMAKECIKEILDKVLEMEAYDMISNLGKNIEDSIIKKVNSAIKETSLEIAKKLLQRNIPIDIISESTELTIEEVEEIRKGLSN